MVICGIHNHELVEEAYDILGRLNCNERLIVNDITKYHMVSRFIVTTFKDRDVDNMMTM